VYKILLESQVKEKPIAYTKWEKCLKKDRNQLYIEKNIKVKSRLRSKYAW
jgi:hypothetical protein